MPYIAILIEKSKRNTFLKKYNFHFAVETLFRVTGVIWCQKTGIEIAGLRLKLKPQSA